MKKIRFPNRPFMAAMCLSAFFAQNNLAATITSISDGDWTATSSWDLGPGGVPRVPTSADDVVILHTVTLDISPMVASLLITGATGKLIGPFAVNVAGPLVIESAGSLNNTGNVVAGSVAITYAGSVLNNTGNVTTAGALNIGFSASLANSGNVSAGSLSATFSGVVNNTGDVAVGSLLTVGYSATLNNGGDVVAGSLNIGNYQPTIGGPGATGTVTVNGAATIDMGTDTYNGFLIGKTLVLKGATTKSRGQFYIDGGATLRNAATGTLTLNNFSAFGFNGDNTGTIENLGTIAKSTPATILFERALFDNSGTVQITGGTIELQGSGGTFSAGAVTIGSGASLKMVGLGGAVSYDFTGGSVTGMGKLDVGGNVTATFSGMAAFLADMEIATNGTVADNTSPGLAPRNINLPGGTYEGSGAPSLSGSLTINGGIFNPDGNAAIAGPLNFLAGSIGGATATTSFVTVAGLVNATANNARDLYKKELTCNGGANLSAPGMATHTGTLTIPTGDILSCNTGPGNLSLGHADGGALKLNGTLNQTGSSILLLEKLTITNNGAMNINGGEAHFSGDNAISYAGSGSISVATGAALKQADGPNALLNYSNATFTNNGSLEGFDLKFNGTTAQTLAGNGMADGLMVNNTGGLNITGEQTVTGNVQFLVDAKVSINASNLTCGGVSGDGPARYFVTLGQGMLVLPIAAAASRTFHVGPGASSHNPITISTGASDASSFGVRAQFGFDGDKPPGGPDYVNRQWQIDRFGGTQGVSLKFQWGTPGHVAGSFTPGNCHVSHWTGTGWASFSNGEANCASGTCTRTQAGVSDFSPFGVASGSALPIELKSFRGHESGPANHLEWETAAESNTKAGHLQRSLDGISGWSAIADRAAAGNSTAPVFYEANDAVPPVEAYYRVLFEDMDGKTEVSPIVFIKREKAAAGPFSVYPNPAAADGFWLHAGPDAIGQPLTVQVFDAAGRSVFFWENEQAAGEQFIFTGNKLPAGAYLLKIGPGAQSLPIVIR